MLDLLFTILALTLVGSLSVLLVLAVLGFLGMEAAGSILERIVELFVPARKTGLGATGIVDNLGIVVRRLDARGRDSQGTIRVAGELWSARSRSGRAIEEGTRVRVVSVEGMVAVVESASSSP